MDSALLENVSRETLDKLEQYHALLLKWQGSINLVSPNTIPDAWERHFLDSLQLLEYIPEDCKTLFDFGSGAGFPGLVLACAHSDIDVHVIESDQRKCSFMRTVSRETKTPINIHNMRIESFNSDAVPGVITARALASLHDLCTYIVPWTAKNPHLKIILQKGQNYKAEIGQAREQYAFEVGVHDSQYGEKSVILAISELCKRDSF